MCPDFHVTPQLSRWQGRHHSCRGLHPLWSARGKGKNEAFDLHGLRSLTPPVQKLRLRAPCVGRALRWGEGGTPAPCTTTKQAACLPLLPSVLKGACETTWPGNDQAGLSNASQRFAPAPDAAWGRRRESTGSRVKLTALSSLET